MDSCLVLLRSQRPQTPTRPRLWARTPRGAPVDESQDLPPSGTARAGCDTAGTVGGAGGSGEGLSLWRPALLLPSPVPAGRTGRRGGCPGRQRPARPGRPSPDVTGRSPGNGAPSGAGRAGSGVVRGWRRDGAAMALPLLPGVSRDPNVSDSGGDASVAPCSGAAAASGAVPASVGPAAPFRPGQARPAARRPPQGRPGGAKAEQDAVWLSVGPAGGGEAQALPEEAAPGVGSKRRCHGEAFPLSPPLHSLPGRGKVRWCYVCKPPPVLPCEGECFAARSGLRGLAATVGQFELLVSI